MTLSAIQTQVIESTISALPTSSSLGADYYVRQLIFEAAGKQSNITGFYKAVLRNLKNLFGGFSILDSQGELKPVKCVHGLTERAIAAQHKANTITLPLISIYQERNSSEKSQQRFNPNYSTEKVWDDKKQRAIRIVSLVPKPISVEYKLSIWATYSEHLDQLAEQVQRLFNPFIEVNLPFTKYGIILLSQDFNEVELEVADQEDRTLIRSYTVTVETHLPSPKYLMTNTGLIEYHNVEGAILDEPRT